ncbi:MAG: substrate-binding domain-containing protein [Candidatus Omnitrophota bacterium]
MKKTSMADFKITKRKKTFVLVVPRFEDIFNSFYSGEVIKGVTAAASRLGIDILVHLTDRNDHQTWLSSSLLNYQPIDGVIFADIDNDLNVVKRVIRKGIPVIILNNYLKQPINCISIDNYKAGAEAAEIFVKNKHTRIATIAGEQRTQAGQTRLMGFCDALKTMGIDVPKNYIAFGDFLRTPARKAAEKLLDLKNPPTAIFAASDVMALEVMDVALGKKIKIPEELSLIGFDDNPLAFTASISLSTFAQPIGDMGRLGVEHLKKLNEGKEPFPFKLMLPAVYVSRNSVSKIK